MTWLFSYGSNHPEQLSQRLERPIHVQEGAYASGWRRVFRGWSQKWQGGVASLEKKAGATVYGWATQVTPADLALLDRYEGVASGNYRRETIPITLQSGKRVKAVVYIANSTQFNQPSRAYLEACAKTVGTFWSDDGRPVAVEDFAINPRKKCRRCSRPVRDSELCDSCAWTVAEQEEANYLDRHVAAPSVCEWCEGTGQYAGGICRACSINPPSPTGGARVPGWLVRFHKEYKTRLEAWASEKLGRPVKLGQVYGCGHYGCVYQLPGEPWVLKLTRDPNEGPIWEKIREYNLDGFARVKAIAKLGRALRHRKRIGPVYVILREDIVPYMGSQTATVLDGAGRRLAISGISDATASKIDTDPDPLYAMRSIRTTTYSLQEYRRHATDYVARKRGREQAAEGALTVAEAALMSEPTGYAVGEALAELARDGIFLRDVHLGNVGWRQHPVIDGDEKSDQGLVIYDPGHTPAEPREVEAINPQDDELRRLQREWKESRDPKVRGKIIRLLRRIGKKYVHPKSKRLRGTSRRLATLREIRIPSSWLQRIGSFSYRGDYIDTVDTSVTELSDGQIIYSDLIHGSESTYVRVERHLRDRVRDEDPDVSSDLFLEEITDGQVVQMPPLVYGGQVFAPAESFVIRVVQE